MIMDVTLLALLLASLVSVESVMFYLPANSKRCLKEEIHKDVLVTGEYTLSEGPGQKTNLRVSNILHSSVCEVLHFLPLPRKR